MQGLGNGKETGDDCRVEGLGLRNGGMEKQWRLLQVSGSGFRRRLRSQGLGQWN